MNYIVIKGGVIYDINPRYKDNADVLSKVLWSFYLKNSQINNFSLN